MMNNRRHTNHQYDTPLAEETTGKTLPLAAFLSNEHKPEYHHFVQELISVGYALIVLAFIFILIALQG